MTIIGSPTLVDDDGDGIGYILCRIEGCPRTQPGDGQEHTCGLAKLIGSAAAVKRDDPLCGAGATVSHWYAMGIFD